MGHKIYDNHRVFNVCYHIVWIPKYRKKILVGSIKEDLLKFLYKKAYSIGISIEAIEIMPDHIHLFIRSNPNLSVSYIVKHRC